MNYQTLTPSTTEGIIPPPAVSRELLRYLRQVYPNRLPLKIDLSDRELGALFGAQRVITHLEGLLQQQEENLLTANVS